MRGSLNRGPLRSLTFLLRVPDVFMIWEFIQYVVVVVVVVVGSGGVGG